MALFMIGIGLNDEKDITVKGLELVKSADIVYLESYTSTLNVPISNLEEFYGKKVILADREIVENGVDKILEEASSKNVAFLVIGDVFSATTHAGMLMDAKEKGVSVEIVHNTSILNVVTETGLFLYQFGKITSIPFNYSDVKVPVDVFNDNYEKGYHTLFLFDLNPSEKKFLKVSEVSKYLILKGISGDLICVGCARMGGVDQEIKVSKLKDFVDFRFEKTPQCLIIPGKMHFLEEEFLERFK
ncbi:diphthine synthase [Candidatus Woesearchaeota archaeon]|jgi:diphthine methyl ester synthase|nr:diphthine synthase [Candidatus Woesearchaeota archaeon]MBT7237503.1 diphthine synthase [Candidatus Woesearchaeota archaeon]